MQCSNCLMSSRIRLAPLFEATHYTVKYSTSLISLHNMAHICLNFLVTALLFVVCHHTVNTFIVDPKGLSKYCADSSTDQKSVTTKC